MAGIFQLKRGLDLWLASASPRRADLLSRLGLSIKIIRPENAEPAPLPNQAPEEYANVTARAKAIWALSHLPQSRKAVIAADTIVCVNGAILGKPANSSEALAMLETLNGRQHEVYTAAEICLSEEESISILEKTTVQFANWPLAVLKAYAESGEPLDKAGAYGIQEKGAFLSTAINGSWTNVMGLPLAQVVGALLANGVICAAKNAVAEI